MSRRVAARSLLVVSAAVTLLHAQNPRDQHRAGVETFNARVVATGLENPWEVTWGPDGFLWVTERTAFRVTRIDPADGSKHVALKLDGVFQSVVQDGLMGLALHPDLLRGQGRDYVYLAYTYDADPGPELARRLRVRRYTYDSTRQVLTAPQDLIDGIPAHDDHGGGRLAIGPDGKLYLSRGDDGSNFLANYCNPIRSQELPTAHDVEERDWSTYRGKILRLELDGAIPADNPVLAGVRSHVYTYGHRNVQGLVFGPGGLLYASEHGPSSDDELNLIEAGKNYGWPHIAGFKDDRGYVYANWSESAGTPCPTLKFSTLTIPPSVPQAKESSWSHPDFAPPLITMFTVPDGYDFASLGTATIGPGGLDIYTSAAIPGWSRSLLVTGMRAGRVYRVKLGEDGRRVASEPLEYFTRANRYRDLALSPDGRRIFLATDNFGPTQDTNDQRAGALENPGQVLEFTYVPRKEP